MKKLVLLLIIAVALLVVFHRQTAETPEKVYREFATAMVDLDFERAANFSEGLSERGWEKVSPLHAIGYSMIQDTFRPLYTIESQRELSENEVEIRAMQAVQFNPPGVESAMRPAMVAKVGQTARLKKTGDGWKVIAFENDVRSVDSLTEK